MNIQQHDTNVSAADGVLLAPNGAAAAAILSAGLGCAAMGVFALAGDAFDAANKFFTFYKPTGGLSGVSTCAIIVWLVSWFVLSRLWKAKNVKLGIVNVISFASLGVGLLLTFPPFMDFLQGK